MQQLEAIKNHITDPLNIQSNTNNTNQKRKEKLTTINLTSRYRFSKGCCNYGFKVFII
jgi:hypothetical protein